MKIRILSDVHYDVGLNGEPNQNGEKVFDAAYFGQLTPTDVTLIAGDLSVLPQDTEAFLQKYCPNQLTYFIGGNHLVYRHDYKPLPDIIRDYRRKFPLTHSYWRFLENDFQFIPNTNNQLAVMGSIFYTDYKYKTITVDEYNRQQEGFDVLFKFSGLPCKKHTPVKRLTPQTMVQQNMRIANNALNDFRWGMISKTRQLYPSDYLQLNKLAQHKILKCYHSIMNVNPKAKVIFMTHHGLSPKCIPEAYKDSLLNGSYVSDMEHWIDDNMPNVRLVVSGHVHSRSDFVFGKHKIRYICNPVGYLYRGEDKSIPAFNPNKTIFFQSLLEQRVRE